MTKSRNLSLRHIAYEGTHAILYYAYIDNFGHQLYNIGVLTLDGQWKTYVGGCGAWGDNGMDYLLASARSHNDEAKLLHEHKDDMHYIINAVRDKKVNWQMVYEVMGYYVNEVTGEYVGHGDRGCIGR